MLDDLHNTDDIELLRKLAINAYQRAEALQRQQDRREDRIQELELKNKALEDELGKLLQQITQLTTQLALATNKDVQLQLELKLRELRRQLNQHATEAFGSRSERRSTGKSKPKDKTDKEQTGHGPTPQPSLPRIPVVHTLDDADCTCPKCGDDLRLMANQFEESELVATIHRTIVMHVEKRQKYRCGGCGHIDTALGPLKPIPGGRYDLSFAVQIALDKYLDHLPLERQVKRMGRQGLRVTRQTLFDQLLALYTVLLPTLVALKERTLASALLHADETTWRMSQRGSKGSKKWWLWTLTSDDSVYFELLPSRGSAAARQLFEGYAGTVMADGYSVYQSLEGALEKAGGQQTPLTGGIEALTNYVLAACWMHARRPLYAAEKNSPEASRALDLIGALYAVEDEAVEAAGGDPITLLEHRRRLREERSRNIVTELKLWRDAQRALPKTKLADGVSFLRNHWTQLTRFLEDPRIPLDNGEAERQIRGPVVGRKNHYGSRSEEGGRVATLFYSLLQTCVKLGVEPGEYLTVAVTRALNTPGTVTLPHDYKAELEST